MTGPEVTRQQAEKHAWIAHGHGHYTDAWCCRTARTVVALYDQLDAAHETMSFLTENVTTRADREETLRACVDRLRDGWVGDGDGCWLDEVGLTRPIREPMTPAEQAVMDR